MATNVDLYEALKGVIPAEAARMIAEVGPPARELATKHDVARLGKELHREMSRVTRWMLGAMIPIWLGVYGTLIALVTLLLRG